MCESGIDNQYMLGGSLMAAPVSSTALYATRSIYLPAGCQWMDYNNGYVYEGGQTIQYTSHCSVLPLFVRVGAIIPMAGKGNNTRGLSDPNLYVDLYPADEETAFTLYEDDGISYDYEQGAYCTTEFSVKRSDGLIEAVVNSRQIPADAQKSYQPSSRSMILQLHYRRQARRGAKQWLNHQRGGRIRLCRRAGRSLDLQRGTADHLCQAV